MAGKALCQDPSQRDGKIKRKSLRKRRLFSIEWFPTGLGSPFDRGLSRRGYPAPLAPSEGCFRPPQGLAPLCKGSWQGRQALTEGLWVSCRNGLPVPGHLLLHPTYNPSASHPLSTSPYTGEARGWEGSQATFSCTVPTTPPLRIRSAPPLTQGSQAPRGTGDRDQAGSQGAYAPAGAAQRAQAGKAPALTARTWPPGAPPNNPGCASGWCCRPPE